MNRAVQSLLSAGRVALFASALLAACAQESAPEPPPQVCAPLAFRSCDTDACRGVQQCASSGLRYSSCACVVTDAGYADAPDVGLDADPDATADASPDADPDATGDADADASSDAQDAPDGSVDAGADAG
ncbi:MAG TPA: hypothetical protein PKA88_21090 [Polyangiaceae bacterium]|nr:hypothetical protein [Polyangiaceae bacterium]